MKNEKKKQDLKQKTKMQNLHTRSRPMGSIAAKKVARIYSKLFSLKTFRLDVVIVEIFYLNQEHLYIFTYIVLTLETAENLVNKSDEKN